MGERGLVRLAVAALAATAATTAFFDGTGGSRSADFAFLAVVLGAAAFAAAWLWAPAGRTSILAAPVLAAPFTLLLSAESFAGWIARLPVFSSILTSSVRLWFLTLSLQILLLFTLGALHAAWATLAVRRSVAGLPPDPRADFRSALDLLPRSMGLCLVGGAGILVPSAILVALGLPAFLVGVGLLGWSLFWNFFTAAVLLEGFDPRVRFGEALGRGTIRSWALRKSWWKPMAAQLVLLGAAVYVDATSAGGLTRTRGWSMTGFWTGGYEATSRWLAGHASAVNESCPAIWMLLSKMTFGILAVAIKCEIAAILARDSVGPAPGPAAPPAPGDVAGGAGAR